MGKVEIGVGGIVLIYAIGIFMGAWLIFKVYGDSIRAAQRAMKEPATAWELYIEAKDYADNQYKKAYGLGREEK